MKKMVLLLLLIPSALFSQEIKQFSDLDFGIGMEESITKYDLDQSEGERFEYHGLFDFYDQSLIFKLNYNVIDPNQGFSLTKYSGVVMSPADLVNLVSFFVCHYGEMPDIKDKTERNITYRWEEGGIISTVILTAKPFFATFYIDAYDKLLEEYIAARKD